jgi:hypothetical protein
MVAPCAIAGCQTCASAAPTTHRTAPLFSSTTVPTPRIRRTNRPILTGDREDHYSSAVIHEEHHSRDRRANREATRGGTGNVGTVGPLSTTSLGVGHGRHGPYVAITFRGSDSLGISQAPLGSSDWSTPETTCERSHPLTYGSQGSTSSRPAGPPSEPSISMRRSRNFAMGPLVSLGSSSASAATSSPPLKCPTPESRRRIDPVYCLAGSCEWTAAVIGCDSRPSGILARFTREEIPSGEWSSESTADATATRSPSATRTCRIQMSFRS